MKSQYSVSVIGGGSWGTALAIAANRAGSKVLLATRNRNVIDAIDATRINDIYLPDAYIDPAIGVTGDFAVACRSDFLIFAMPSQCVRSACIAISDFVAPTVPIVLGSKGIERGSLLFMSEVVQSVLPNNPTAALTGPNFAKEVASGLPSATTLACADAALSETLLYAVGGKMFRPYFTPDLIGAQVGGAVKNVIAIACGIAAGRNMGENARAALITRGFAEMARLALAKGGRMETLAGLSGMGDLVLTCSSAISRNMSFGMAVGRGEAPNVMLSEGRNVIEGATSAESAVRLAARLGVEMPICAAVHAVLNEGAAVEVTIDALLSRPFAPEYPQYS